MFLMPDVTPPVAQLGWFPNPECPIPRTAPADPLPDLNYDIHVFSAFLVTTNEHAVLITSLVRNQSTKGNRNPTRHPPLVCIIRASNTTIKFKAHIRLVWTYFNPSFWNALILCPPPKETFLQDEDIRVAVAARYSGARSLRWLQLHRPPKRSPRKCCAVCVRPLFGTISLWKFVEFIAHYQVVGATSFYFYDLNMTSDLKLLVSRMQSLGVDLTLVPFKLIMDTVEHEHVHAHGQMPALYDYPACRILLRRSLGDERLRHQRISVQARPKIDPSRHDVRVGLSHRRAGEA
ncbi:hypothetical protein HPB49_013789 [Dermacentor silvarum]|uniref:Uncharacterized protein n=1 Tax=Dermacentor silvarum TaxID=543639 RepID=A0ACB8C3Z8_DERSI|nr:hypothetical protein HPB49_013789 [Dermacentor silvarum]